MMHMSPATGWDIRFAVKALSEQNHAEREVVGLSVDDTVKHFVALLERGPSETTMHEGQPAAVFGIIEGDDFNDTWFLATRAAFAAGVKGLRYSRARVQYFRERYGKPLRSISYSPLVDAPKWFKVLGFVEAPARVDGAKVFIYR